MSRKKRVLIHSNHCRFFTGFAKHKRQILRALFDTGKYELFEFSNGIKWDGEETKGLPWECRGSIPTDEKTITLINSSEFLKRKAAYGSETVDEAVKLFKPDVYIGIEDIWAFTNFWKKPWWNRVTPVVWTTLDSLPIYPEAFVTARNTPNFWTWASFAEKEMKTKGLSHVKTVNGSVDDKSFFRLPADARKSLRKRFGIKDSTYIVGFVFRNQLRKSVPNILEGFKLFKDKNPDSKLLLHTCWSEDKSRSWDIPKLIKNSGLSMEDVLTTYACSECGGYEIKKFDGEEKDCKLCGAKKTLSTVSIKNGVSEKQLNEIYNLMDVYCHPFTSGGQEMPIQEAKLTELVTLVTDYSCGEDYCTEQSGGLALEWDKYYEPGSLFIKATTKPISIFNQLDFCFRNKEKCAEMGKIARNFILETCSIKKIVSTLEQFLDNCSTLDWDFNFKEEKCDLSYRPDFWNADSLEISSVVGPSGHEPTDQEKFREVAIKFITSIYENLLKNPAIDSDEMEHFISQLEKGAKPKAIFQHFLNIAKQINSIKFAKDVYDLLDGQNYTMFVCSFSEEVCYLSAKHIKEFVNQNEGKKVAISAPTEFHAFFESIHGIKVLPYFEGMENEIFNATSEKIDRIICLDLEIKSGVNFYK